MRQRKVATPHLPCSRARGRDGVADKGASAGAATRYFLKRYLLRTQEPEPATDRTNIADAIMGREISKQAQQNTPKTG